MAFVLLGWDQCLWKYFVLTVLSCLWFGFLRPKVRLIFSPVHRYRLKITSRYNFVWVCRVSLASVCLRRTLIGRAQ